MKRIVGSAFLGALAITAAAACSGGGQVAGSGNGGGSAGSTGTFTLGVASDPGNLDPQRSLQEANNQVAALAYDPAVTLSKDRQLQPGIVTKWQAVNPTTWSLTVRGGVTCSDGTTMDAKTVAANLNYIADPKNASSYTGVSIPGGSTATASGSTVTVKLSAASPFFMQGLAELPLVCSKGIANRAMLATKSDGTGIYQVSSVAPGSQITYALRKGYTPGLSGDTGSTASRPPAKVVVQIVSSATTTANLLLNGQLNGAIVTGTDQKRLQGNSLFSTGQNNLTDQIYYNHSGKLPTADASVRKALTMGLNLQQVVAADTGNLGTQATGMLATPKICPGSLLSSTLPAYNASGARALLAQAGYTAAKPLSIVLAYSSDVATASDAAQVVASEWRQLGVNVQLLGKPAAQLTTAIVGNTVTWDALLFDLGFVTPAQISQFVSGEGAPKGDNFSFINNSTYNKLAAQASTKPGTGGCTDWNNAETALYTNTDLVPTGQIPYLYYGKNATFQVSGYNLILPGTISLQG